MRKFFLTFEVKIKQRLEYNVTQSRVFDINCCCMCCLLIMFICSVRNICGLLSAYTLRDERAVTLTNSQNHCGIGQFRQKS